MKSPYSDLADRSFWRTGVAQSDPCGQPDFFAPKFLIDKNSRLFTSGSCFAQHLSRALADEGFSVIDCEPLPDFIAPQLAEKFGYGLFSARYGNIYTQRQLLQLLQEALGEFIPQDVLWEKDGRYFDALRPTVEPKGHETPELVALARQYHLAALMAGLSKTDVFVFTCGLTECWEHRESGTVFPTAPGTIAGAFDPEIYQFRNFGYEDVLNDFNSLRDLLVQINPDIRILLSLSPVPLTATAGPEHALVANTGSKSILRAVCGEMAKRHDNVDYFPSFEVIAALPDNGRYFADDKRTVVPDRVTAIMQMFLRSHGQLIETFSEEKATPMPDKNEHGVHCEDELLEAFQK